MPDETQEQQVPATEPTEVEVQPEADAQPEEQQEGLPEDASERTKREFEKLKKHNEDLARKLAERDNPKPSLLDAYQPQVPAAQAAAQVAPNLTQARVEEITKQLWDEEGQIDGQELQRRLALAAQAEARAIEAEKKAQAALERIARFEADGQKKVLYAKYPELDPSSSQFNEEAYDLVRNEMVKQLWDKGEQDALAAAEKMSKYWLAQKVSPQKVEAQEARRAVTQTVSGKASSGANQDYEELRKRSLYSKEAMEERIRRAGI